MEQGLEVLCVSRSRVFHLRSLFSLHSADPRNAWLNCKAVSITVIYMNYLPIILNYQAA